MLHRLAHCLANTVHQDTTVVIRRTARHVCRATVVHFKDLGGELSAITAPWDDMPPNARLPNVLLARKENLQIKKGANPANLVQMARI